MSISLIKEKLKSNLRHSFVTFREIFLIGPLPFEHKFSHSPDAIIYVDGGIDRFPTLSKVFCNVPSISLGDGDSIQGSQKLEYLFPQDKAESDLKICLSSLPENITHLELFGFEGGRNDHFLCNLGEIHQFLNTANRDMTIIIHGKSQDIKASNKELIHFQCHSVFSLLSLSQNSLDISGECEYTGNKILLTPFSSRGLSNIGYGEITISSKKPLFIIISHVQ